MPAYTYRAAEWPYIAFANSTIRLQKQSGEWGAKRIAVKIYNQSGAKLCVNVTTQE